MFVAARLRAGLDSAVKPYSLRHTLAEHMQDCGVPGDQIDWFLGHFPTPQAKMRYVYARTPPSRLSEAIQAIEEFMAKVRAHLKNPDGLLPEQIVAQRGLRGLQISDETRSRVQQLILNGIAYPDIVRETGVTMSALIRIRMELAKATPLGDRRRLSKSPEEAFAEAHLHHAPRMVGRTH
jgi:hypothetical protein